MGDELLNGYGDSVLGQYDGKAPEASQGQAAITSVATTEKPHLANGKVNGADGTETHLRNSERDKSDSEAETVVLSGKVDDQKNKATKAIKLEDAESSSEAELNDASTRQGRTALRKGIDGSRRTPLKRKRGEELPNNEANQHERSASHASSSNSSPAPRRHSSKSSESHSDRSRSSPPADDDQKGKSRKRTAAGDKKPAHKHRRSREITSDFIDAIDGRVRRGKTNHDQRSQRSESPQQQTKSRVRPTQVNAPPTHFVKKRRKPAPLNVDRRTRASEDVQIESDDSSSVHSHRRLKRLPSGAMSPAKISHKKNRDRNGRTLLARACMQGVEEARRWVNERPQDINEPDNAGNTPLQIASLAGMDEVVKLLLDTGCDISCRNIDRDTPLIDAVENSHLDVVQILLKAGADPRQRNAKGQEPVELVDLDDEVGGKIQAALLQARRESDGMRKPSEDHRQSSGRDIDTPSALGPGASPTGNNRSPPPFDLGGRKRGVRSQHTDDALLWVNATPQRLLVEAGNGNLKFVDHILKMRPEAETDAVLAAVKGGHFDILNLMVAMASPDPDPEPLYSPDHRQGFNTPMLAAIGRGSPDIVQLLSNQSGFNPTRRMFKGLSYSELAKERKGEAWEDEVVILENAIQDYEHHGGRRSHTSSPKRVRTKRTVPKEESSEPSSSPQEHRRVRNSDPQIKEDPDNELKRRPSWHGTAARQRGIEHDPTPSDRLPNRINTHKSRMGDQRTVDVDSAMAHQRTDSLKPKRKLMSGNELKSDQEGRRRSKAPEDEQMEASQSVRKPKHRQSFSNHTGQRDTLEENKRVTNKVKKASSEEPARIAEDPSKKRMRVSVSPQASKSDLTEASKKKKRQRVNSHDNATEQEHPIQAPSIPMIGDIVSSPTSLQSPAHGTAPVAFMGASTSSGSGQSSAKQESPTAFTSPVSHAVSQKSLPPPPAAPENSHNVGGRHVAGIERMEVVATDQRRSEAERLQEEAVKRKEALLERQEKELQKRLKREHEEAQFEAERQALEAERRAQADREAEEARVAKAKRDEELQRRRLEEERARKEEQERRRREREDRERLRRAQQQEEEARARLEALPNGLRRATEIGPEKARDRKEIKRWLPLRTATTYDLDPSCSAEVAHEEWIVNVQAAPLLANQDLDLSQYTAWTRLMATSHHLEYLWRQFRRLMAVAVSTSFLSAKEAIALEYETKPKFFNLTVFWIKLADFKDIVPRHPHLNGMNLGNQPMALNFIYKGQPSTPKLTSGENGHAGSPLVNGHLTNGD
ncbi:uncharacterized protein KY384_001057 [Bacidia gigantensis]|uniref:uncharacterized protein n=1 Tax=Bacidia gigantensis TaxID=2732470 RepID=UPI001D05B4A2|nr:uncharacterized protein KY384_001057 [Bacidia gigantensis]KAG8534213.1 hypothetical protein KY384_001057 [Bacidia gigantensis]